MHSQAEEILGVLPCYLCPRFDLYWTQPESQRLYKLFSSYLYTPCLVIDVYNIFAAKYLTSESGFQDNFYLPSHRVAVFNGQVLRTEFQQQNNMIKLDESRLIIAQKFSLDPETSS